MLSQALIPAQAMNAEMKREIVLPEEYRRKVRLFYRHISNLILASSSLVKEINIIYIYDIRIFNEFKKICEQRNLFIQAKKIRREIKSEISLGSANIVNDDDSDESLEHRKSILNFYRDIVNYIVDQPDLKQFIDLKEQELGRVFISAALARLYKTAACGEYTNLAYVKFLMLGIQFSIERIKIISSDGTHAFLVINRSADSNIKDVTTWKDILRFDVWPLVDKVDLFPGYSFTKQELLNLYIQEIFSIESCSRVETCLTADSWQNLSDYMKVAANLIDEAVIGAALAFSDIEYSSTEECHKIKEKFIEASQEYQVLAEQKRQEQTALSTLSLFSKSTFIQMDKTPTSAHIALGCYNTSLSNGN